MAEGDQAMVFFSSFIERFDFGRRWQFFAMSAEPGQEFADFEERGTVVVNDQAVLVGADRADSAGTRPSNGGFARGVATAS